MANTSTRYVVLRANTAIKGQSFAGGVFSELAAGMMLLYGGWSADETPLNEAWMLDTKEMIWTQMYSADASLLTCQCTFGAVKDGRLMAIDSSRKSRSEVVCCENRCFCSWFFQTGRWIVPRSLAIERGFQLPPEDEGCIC